MLSVLLCISLPVMRCLWEACAGVSSPCELFFCGWEPSLPRMFTPLLVLSVKACLQAARAFSATGLAKGKHL